MLKHPSGWRNANHCCMFYVFSGAILFPSRYSTAKCPRLKVVAASTRTVLQLPNAFVKNIRRRSISLPRLLLRTKRTMLGTITLQMVRYFGWAHTVSWIRYARIGDTSSLLNGMVPKMRPCRDQHLLHENGFIAHPFGRCFTVAPLLLPSVFALFPLRPS